MAFPGPEVAARAPLGRERAAVLVLLALLAALSWLVLIRQAAGMGMAMGLTMGMAAGLFLAMWVVMMVAMMLPAAAPMILTFHQVQAGRRRRGEAFVATWVFVAAYLAVWSATGLIAWLGATAAERAAAALALSARDVARLGGAVIILAGLYQFSSLKNACLTKCRTPISFVMTSWREGTLGALRMGAEHGLYCLGCCWLLFVLLFPLGVMNVAAMAVLTLLVLAEKSLPWGRATVNAIAAALVLYGAVVMVYPRVLPTFMDMGGMSNMGAMR
jgi:predicted metal-binding membrane protein